jgi:hypothetical protein
VGWFGFGISRRSTYFEPHEVLGIPRPSEDVRNPVLEAALAEYHALREEMRWLREEIAQYQAFALAITATLGPLLGYELAKQTLWVIPTLVVIPLPFAVLGFLFFRQNLEVYIEAAYIRDRIRPLIVKQCPTGVPVPELWSWEQFKHEAFRRVGAIPFLGHVVSHRLALSMRLSLFLGPAGAVILIETLLVFRRGGEALIHDYSTMWCLLMLAAFLVDLTLIVLLLVLLWVRGDAGQVVLDNSQFAQSRRRKHLNVPSGMTPAPTAQAVPLVPPIAAASETTIS